MKNLILILIVFFVFASYIRAQEYPTYEEGRGKLEILSWKLRNFENLKNLVSYEVRFSNFNSVRIKELLNSIKIKSSANEKYYISSTLIDNTTSSPKEGIIVFKIDGIPPNVLYLDENEVILEKINGKTKHEDRRNYELDEVINRYMYYNIDLKFKDSVEAYYKNIKSTFLSNPSDNKLLLYTEVKVYSEYYSGNEENAFDLLYPNLNEIKNYEIFCKTYSDSLLNFYDKLFSKLFEENYSKAKNFYYDKDNMDSAFTYFNVIKNKYLNGLKDRTMAKDTILYGYANSWYLSHSSDFSQVEVEALRKDLRPLINNESNSSIYYYKAQNLMGNLYYYLKDYPEAKKFYSIVLSKADKYSLDYHTADKNLNKLYLDNPVKDE